MLLNREKLRDSLLAWLIAEGLTWLIGFTVFAAGAAALFTQDPHVNTLFWAIFSGTIRGGLLVLYAFICVGVFGGIRAMVEDFFGPGPYKSCDPMDDSKYPHVGEAIEQYRGDSDE